MRKSWFDRLIYRFIVGPYISREAIWRDELIRQRQMEDCIRKLAEYRARRA